MLNRIGIDLLCVAAYYSNRWVDSETFINMERNERFREDIFFLANNSKEDIVDLFVSTCLQVSQSDTFTISWNKMHYIWKLFLFQHHLPAVIYNNDLKERLKARLLNYIIDDHDSLTFHKVTSKYMPKISHFLHFWEEHIKVIPAASMSHLHCYEIDELFSLYKASCSTANKVCVSEVDVVKIIEHFFVQEVEIKENKYIYNIVCDIWNKPEDTLITLPKCKSNLRKDLIDSDDYALISLEDMYNCYRNVKKENAQTLYPSRYYGDMIVSKQYFETFVKHHLQEYMKYDNTFISGDWVFS